MLNSRKTYNLYKTIKTDNLVKAIKKYNLELITKHFDHVQHDKIIDAYKRVIQEYDDILNTINTIQKEKDEFIKTHDAKMRTIILANPSIQSFEEGKGRRNASFKHRKNKKKFNSYRNRMLKVSKKSKHSRH